MPVAVRQITRCRPSSLNIYFIENPEAENTCSSPASSPCRYSLTLAVSYDGGSKSFRITVPPAAPITRFEATDRSAFAIGSSVFIKTDPGNQASLVTVVQGVTPPM